MSTWVSQSYVLGQVVGTLQVIVVPEQVRQGGQTNTHEKQTQP